MTTRPAKRRKRNAATDDPVATLISSQLRALIERVLDELHVTGELATPLANESQLLCVRHAPLAVGIGVLTSDVAVRLFHARGVRQRSSTLKSGSDPPFASSTELAAFCVDVMERKRREQASYFAGITRIALPDDAARSGGVHGDRILIHTRQFPRVHALATPLESRIGVLLRDDAVLVVHKPHGMLSVDGNLCEDDNVTPVTSVQSLVQEYYPDARMVHRLDQETSGILVVALTKSASQHLNQQFRDRSVDKTYAARVLGNVDGECGVIDVRMAPSKTENLVQRVVEQEDEDGEGKATRTEWRVVERRVSETHQTPSTLMELKPVTGKTHQLRVHMQYMGHPILGDSLYSSEKVQALAPRLLLHAAKIQFEHPVTNERITVTCPCEF
jgi:tRNA pseudouridine32 synthase / 23S rRNA pseudouridine746 synthase